MASGPITSWQIDGEIVDTVTDFIFLGSKITADMKWKKCLLLGRKVLTNLDNMLKNRDITFANKGPHSRSYCFPSSHVWIWDLDHEEGWALKNWHFQIVVLEKTLENPLDSKAFVFWLSYSSILVLEPHEQYEKAKR